MPSNDINSPEIIDKIYDVAVDPARLEELVDVWEAKIAPMRLDGVVLDDNSDTSLDHFSRMGLFLDRLQFSDPQDVINEISDAGTMAAVLVSAELKIHQVNPAAVKLFKLNPGDQLSGISPDEDSQLALETAIARAIDFPHADPEFLRFRFEGSEKFIVIRVRGIDKSTQEGNSKDILKPHGLKTRYNNIEDEKNKLALVITTELSWLPSFGNAIKTAFNLTGTEVEVVKALIEGYTIDTIAEQRGRSRATVRTQIKSVFEKTETCSQAELVRICLSILDMVSITDGNAQNVTDDVFETPTLSPTVFHTIIRPNNRRLDHVILGDPKGTPLLYLPCDYGLIRWTARAEAEVAKRGIKVIVPVRAGFGFSDRLPTNVNYEDHVADDIAALLDHHKVNKCAVMSQQGDFWLATIFAARHIERVTSINAMAPMMPFWKREQYERMDKWYKFIIANARFAPKILPYIVKAGFYLALSIGQKNFMSAIFADNKFDMDACADPEIFEAVITGANIVLSKRFTAHEVFAREAIITSKPNWITDLEFLKGKIPIHTHQGVDSPGVPAQTLVEFKEKYDWIDFHDVDQAGELLFFKHWPQILDFIEPFVKNK